MQNPGNRIAARGEVDVMFYDGLKPRRTQLAQPGELPSIKRQGGAI